MGAQGVVARAHARELCVPATRASPSAAMLRSLTRSFTGPEPDEEDGMPLDLGYAVFKDITPSFLRVEDEQDDAFNMCCPRLSWRKRLLGWLICFVLGLLLQVASFGALTQALLGHPGRFATNYTIGNLVSLAGTFFLAGPAMQLRNMTQKNRSKASLFFLVSMVLTMSLVHRNFLGRSLLVLISVAVQWLALTWYTLSYIPYGRKLAKKFLSNLVH